MAALSANDPALQPGFESADTAVQAAAHSEAPPFFVLHGEKDPMVPSAQSRAFSAALRDAGAATVSYAELPNAHHAFDLAATVRSRMVAEAVSDFLGVIYGRRMGARKGSLALSSPPAS
ncbi:carboxylesterase LIPQ [Mycobacterium tuberculosis]|uniref:Carboxylesterase LIPQ n=1 Tax=Mycobacterium tuberculosis TaxID=1773 RepID=A0A916P8B0_MYCTX|nr:carboxylesterase LIPQ [Mycobacterium tuberculosis]